MTDITFSNPKSVSLLAATGGDKAHEEAVRETIAYLLFSERAGYAQYHDHVILFSRRVNL